MNQLSAHQETLEQGRLSLERRDFRSAFMIHSEIAREDPLCFDAWYGCLSALVMNSENPDEDWIHHPNELRIETIASECLEQSPTDRIVDGKIMIGKYIANMERLIKYFEPSFYPSTWERTKAYAILLLGIGSSILFVKEWFDMDSLILCFGAFLLATVIWVSTYRGHVAARKETHPYPAHYQAAVPQCKKTVRELKRILREYKMIR